jgi:hypothetical protein
MPDMQLAQILLADGNRIAIHIGDLLLNPMPDDVIIRCSAIDHVPNVLVARHGQVVGTTLDVDTATIKQTYPPEAAPDLLTLGRHTFLNVMRMLTRIADESAAVGTNVLLASLAAGHPVPPIAAALANVHSHIGPLAIRNGIAQLWLSEDLSLNDNQLPTLAYAAEPSRTVPPEDMEWRRA